jgi:hypothetical protein
MEVDELGILHELPCYEAGEGHQQDTEFDKASSIRGLYRG